MRYVSVVEREFDVLDGSLSVLNGIMTDFWDAPLGMRYHRILLISSAIAYVGLISLFLTKRWLVVPMSSDMKALLLLYRLSFTGLS